MSGSSFNLAEAGFEGAFGNKIFAQDVKSNLLAFFSDQSMRVVAMFPELDDMYARLHDTKLAFLVNRLCHKSLHIRRVHKNVFCRKKRHSYLTGKGLLVFLFP